MGPLLQYSDFLFPMDLKKLIREVPDFPKPGINFFDITTLLKDKDGFGRIIDDFEAYYRDRRVDVVLGIEARGFIFAPTVAYALGTGFVPVRKPKKLPAAVEFMEYELEYGTDRLEIHRDAIRAGQHVLIVDDVLATGGTARAAVNLVTRLGGRLHAAAFLIELEFLGGRGKLGDTPVFSVLQY